MVGVPVATVVVAAVGGVTAKAVVGTRPRAGEQVPLVTDDDAAADGEGTKPEKLAQARCNKIVSRPLVHDSAKVEYIAEDSADHGVSHTILLDHHTTKEQNTCLRERVGKRMGVLPDSIKIMTFKQAGRPFVHTVYASDADIEWKRTIHEEAGRSLIGSAAHGCTSATFLESDSTFLFLFPAGVSFTVAEKIFVATKLRRDYYARWRVNITIVDDHYRAEIGTTSSTTLEG